MEPIAVTRTIDLDAPADEVWSRLVDEAELSSWLGATVRLDAAPGGIGRFDFGTSVRRAVVHTVEPNRRFGFTWWDEDDPDEVSTVEFELDRSTPAGGVRLTITETVVPGGAAAGARACNWVDAAAAWEGRLLALDDRLAERPSPLNV